jgi:hypothetical protein
MAIYILTSSKFKPIEVESARLDVFAIESIHGDVYDGVWASRSTQPEKLHRVEPKENMTASMPQDQQARFRESYSGSGRVARILAKQYSVPIQKDGQYGKTAETEHNSGSTDDGRSELSEVAW